MIILEIMIFSGIISMCFSACGMDIDNNVNLIIVSGIMLGVYNRHYCIKEKNKYK